VAASGTAESLRKQAVTNVNDRSAAASTLLSHPPSTALVVTLDDPSGIGGIDWVEATELSIDA